MRAVVAAVLLVLGACQPAAEAPKEPTPEELGQDEPGPFVPAPVGPPKTYEAFSKTAMSFTPGVLTVTPTPQASPNLPEGAVFAFGNGIILKTTLMPGGAEQGDLTKQPDWTSLFVDTNSTGALVTVAKIQMYSVDAETVPPGTPNDGLCAKTSFLATYAVVSPAAEDMTIAAFQGDEWPPKDETALCGTFTYGNMK